MSTRQTIIKQWRPFLVAAAYVLALPFLTVWAVIRVVRYFRVLRRSVAPTLTCGTCHNQITLVGLWQCECGYTYQGHLLGPCPICHRVPKVARCYHCNATTKLV